jgi:hypothetical protein
MKEDLERLLDVARTNNIMIRAYLVSLQKRVPLNRRTGSGKSGVLVARNRICSHISIEIGIRDIALVIIVQSQ